MFCAAMKFQSLLGFLMRCDIRSSGGRSLHLRVSIPVGFSDALRRKGLRLYVSQQEVSIPVGFSDALRQHLWH